MELKKYSASSPIHFSDADDYVAQTVNLSTLLMSGLDELAEELADKVIHGKIGDAAPLNLSNAATRDEDFAALLHRVFEGDEVLEIEIDGQSAFLFCPVDKTTNTAYFTLTTDLNPVEHPNIDSIVLSLLGILEESDVAQFGGNMYPDEGTPSEPEKV